MVLNDEPIFNSEKEREKSR